MTDPTRIKFLGFDLDLRGMRLTKGELALEVEPQTFDLIRAFAEKPGELWSRDDLIEEVWGGRLVSDAAIDARISLARKALGDDGRRQNIIKTVSRRGYVFLPDTEVELERTKARADRTPPEHDKALSLPERPSIVVRPFTSLGEDVRANHLAQGLRVDMQNALTRLPSVFIVAAGMASATADQSPTVAARNCGVRYALVGQVNMSGNSVRISLQLLDTIPDQFIWAEKYDCKLEDIFQVIDEATEKALLAIDVRIGRGESAASWRRSLRDVRSVEILYRGIEKFFQMERLAMESARKDFLRIADKHDELSIGPTWVALTYWYDLQRGWAVDSEEARRLARDWAEKAINKTDCDGQAYTVLSHVLLLEKDFDGALAAGRSAVSERPNCTHANGFFANVLHYCGMDLEAKKHVDLAIRHAPIHPLFFDVLRGLVQSQLGESEAASLAISDLLSVNPNYFPALILGAVLSESDSELQATDICGRIRDLEPDFSVTEYLREQPYRDKATRAFLENRLCGAGLPE